MPVERTIRRTNRIRIADFSSDPTRCPICLFQPCRPYDVDRHMVNKHAEVVEALKVQCQLCSHRTLQPSDMETHMRVHYGMEDYICGEPMLSEDDPNTLIACSFSDIKAGCVARHRAHVHENGCKGHEALLRVYSAVFRNAATRTMKKTDLKAVAPVPTREPEPEPLFDISASAFRVLAPSPAAVATMPTDFFSRDPESPTICPDVEVPTPLESKFFGDILGACTSVDTNTRLLTTPLYEKFLAGCGYNPASSSLPFLDPSLDPAFTSLGLTSDSIQPFILSDLSLIPAQNNIFDFLYPGQQTQVVAPPSPIDSYGSSSSTTTPDLLIFDCSPSFEYYPSVSPMPTTPLPASSGHFSVPNLYL